MKAPCYKTCPFEQSLGLESQCAYWGRVVQLESSVPKLQPMTGPAVVSRRQTSIYVTYDIVLFLPRPPNRVRKLLCNLRTLNFVALSRRDEVDLSLFLADKAYKFSSRNTNYKFLH